MINQNFQNSQKLYFQTAKEWYDKYLESYFMLLRKAAVRRAEARKRILANESDIDEAMKKYRRYDRVINYLFDRINRETKMRKCGNA